MKRLLSCKIAILVFFVLYALSPLTYDLSAQSGTSGRSAGSSEKSFAHTSLYLIAVLYEAAFPPDEPENGPAPDRVLIKKRSAVRRGRSDLVPLSGNIALFADVVPVACQYFGIAGKRAEFPVYRLWKNSGSLYLSSGLSPPSRSQVRVGPFPERFPGAIAENERRTSWEYSTRSSEKEGTIRLSIRQVRPHHGSEPFSSNWNRS